MGQLVMPSHVGAERMDEFWNALVYATLGENLDSASMVNGVRIVDKLSLGNKRRVTDNIRLELWYHSEVTMESLIDLRGSLVRTLETRADESKVELPKKGVHDKKHYHTTKDERPT